MDMCVTPSFFWRQNVIGVWEKVPKGCGICWRCRSNRVNDYVGRALCEADDSDWTVSLTLTYADKDEREYDLAHRVVTPPHFQQFMKRLRRRGHKVRYIVAGEYGDLKGRAHFHAVLFGRGKPPHIPHKRNHYDAKLWPHGHVFADWDADEKALRYALKYIQKDRLSDGWFSLSKKPTIGHGFFLRKAERHVAEGVMPRSFEYQPPGGHKGRPYLMRGATRRDFLRHLAEQWREWRPLHEDRLSEWVRRVLHKLELDDELERRRKAQTLDELLDQLNNTLDANRMTEEKATKVALDVEFQTMPPIDMQAKRQRRRPGNGS